MSELCANDRCIEREAVSMRESAEWKARAHETRAEITTLKQCIAALEAALERIKVEDGPGLDGSPSGPCFKIASAALDGKEQT